MRWIVASLVSLNIFVFIYFQLFSESESLADTAVKDPISSSFVSPSLVLLSETVTAAAPAAADSQVEAPVVNPAQPPSANLPVPPQPAICILVGSFERLLLAEYFVEKLTALGVIAEVRDLAINSEPGYWLHLTPEPSRKEALRRLSELQSRGIDSYVIPSGNLENGISLGMFSKRESADSMRETIRRQGYRPEITTVPREKKETWVLLPQGEAGKLSPERWSELLSSEDYIQKRQNLCRDLASI